jgi:formylglycine-generating enzyme
VTCRHNVLNYWAGCLLPACVVVGIKTTPVLADSIVSSVRAVQRPATAFVDVTYDLGPEDGPLRTVSLTISTNGGVDYFVPAGNITGAIGGNTAPGIDLKLTWDSQLDLVSGLLSDIRVRITACDGPTDPIGMVRIPEGTFEMGDAFGDRPPDVNPDSETPLHTVNVSEYLMERHEVTRDLWNEVYQWAIANGYQFGRNGSGIAPNHPVHSVRWYDIVKWCNARSEMEGRTPAYYLNADQTSVYRTGNVDIKNEWVNWETGFRLPTEAEWEKAARGGHSGMRFPWGNQISHENANFWNDGNESYVTGLSGPHPVYSNGALPYTAPVGSFPPNGYGLYDMAGNVWEWCWDWWDEDYYANSPDTDPKGPPSGTHRALRGGSWALRAFHCRVSDRLLGEPGAWISLGGFRCVLSSVQAQMPGSCFHANSDEFSIDLSIPPSITLHVERNGVELILSWSGSTGDQRLEFSEDPTSHHWVPITQSPILVDGIYRLTQTLPGGTGYYRLRKP